MLADLLDRLALAILSPAGRDRLTEAAVDEAVRDALEAVDRRLERRAALALVARSTGAAAAAEVLEAEGRPDDAADLRAAIAAHQADIEAIRADLAAEAAATAIPAPHERSAGNGRLARTSPATSSIFSNRRH